MLLSRQGTIHREENVRFLCSECEEPAILYAAPTHLRNGFDGVPGEFRGEVAVNTLVQENSHGTLAATMRFVASSRKEIT